MLLPLVLQKASITHAALARPTACLVWFYFLFFHYLNPFSKRVN